MLRRFLIGVHRWLGLALCLLFLLWFPSGIVMMYWDFPSVTPRDRLERSPALDATTIRVAPDAAYRLLGASRQPIDVRLATFDNRPVYRFRSGRDETLVYADTGERRGEVSREMMDRIAAAWTKQPAGAASVAPVVEVDQWTVQGALRTLRPLWKYSWPNGEEVYIAQATGEVVQYTTRTSRLAAYFGAIPHWLYFTPLRKHQAQWSAFVVWSSGIGTVSAILGLIIAVWMYSPSKPYRYNGSATGIPYRGQKRWHTLFGLLFGLGAVTWAFSGMLSMDPFPSRARERNAQPSSIPDAFRGAADLKAFTTKHPREALAQLTNLDVKELELTSFGREPFYLATLAGGDTRIVPLDGEPRVELARQRALDVIAAAARADGGAEISVVDRYDSYYLDRRRARPLPVILARLNDTEHTRYYIDPRTGRIVATYRAGNWVSRWLYHGLHSLDFPWLYDHRPLWDVIVITFMVGGTGLAVTSVILAWKVATHQFTNSYLGSAFGMIAATVLVLRSTITRSRPAK